MNLYNIVVLINLVLILSWLAQGILFVFFVRAAALTSVNVVAEPFRIGSALRLYFFYIIIIVLPI